MDIPKEIKELNKQLYPTGRAWGYVHGSEQVDTEVINFVDGLGNNFVDGQGNAFVASFGAEASPSKRLVNAFLKSYERCYADVFSILNQTVADNEGFDQIDAGNWERVYGLQNNNLNLEDRKSNILRRQSHPNGVAERGTAELIQSELQAAGFDVYVTENRFPDGAGGWEVVDPDALSATPYQYGIAEYGVAEYGGELVGLDYTICANHIEESLDENFFTQESSLSQYGVAEYGVAEYETPTPEPRDTQLRATFFIGGSSFPSIVSVPLARKDEFRQLLLKLKPAQSVVFLYVNYI
jgi:hypothetical protein